MTETLTDTEMQEAADGLAAVLQMEPVRSVLNEILKAAISEHVSDSAAQEEEEDAWLDITCLADKRRRFQHKGTGAVRFEDFET